MKDNARCSRTKQKTIKFKAKGYKSEFQEKTTPKKMCPVHNFPNKWKCVKVAAFLYKTKELKREDG